MDLQARVSLLGAALKMGRDILADETEAKDALAEAVRTFWNQVVVGGHHEAARVGLAALGLLHLADVH